MKGKLISSITVFIMVLILILQNTSIIHVNIYFWDIYVSGSIFYLIVFLIGMAIGLTIHLFFISRKKK
ncbi:MAG: DUF1049 domain-containing protein [Proteobacteria bacterium]|nr:DUF1049 domain-containing protein [Pseudomonadota bacterium]